MLSPAMRFPELLAVLKTSAKEEVKLPRGGDQGS